jgi:nucleoid-associated protein YgaU
MRTEIKIGIAVGLIITVVAVLYLVFARPSAPAGAKPGQTAQGPGAATPVNQVERAGPNQPAPARDALVPRIGVSTEAPSAPPVVEVRAPEPSPAAPAPAPTAKPAPAVLPVKVETAAPAAPAAAPEGAYIVKKGDIGFWSIAEKVYGQGKYWTLISKANPNVDSNNLAVGQKLVIPPLPTVPAAQRPTASAAAAAASPGEKVHVVQQGDSWWSIAVKEYGDGRLWYEIKKANPHVEGSSLQVGMKLKIPPISKTTKPSPPATAPAERAKPQPAAPAEEPGDVRPVFD